MMPKKTKRIFGPRNSFKKALLEALFLPAIGFVLLNAVFVLDAAFQASVDYFIGFFLPMLDPYASLAGYAALKHFAFVLIVVIVFSGIARSEIPDFWKATFFVVPLSAGLVLIGVFFHKSMFLAVPFGLLFWLGTILLIRKNNLPWLYYYSAVLVGLASVALAFFKADI